MKAFGLITIWLSITWSVVLSQDFKCPIFEDLQGCKCYEETHHILCDKDAKSTDTTFTFNKIDNLRELIFSNTPFTKIVLSGVTTELLEFNGNQNLNAIDMDGFGSLETLYIANNKALDISSLLVKDYPKLTKLHITGQKITAFDSTKMSKLTSLYLPDNGIQQLTEASISKLSSLELADLSNNQITLQSGSLAFKLSPQVRIFLSDNQIDEKQIVTSGLSSSTADVQIDLSNNKITDLKRDIFEPLVRANTSIRLNLQGNSIQCSYTADGWAMESFKVQEHLQRPQCSNKNMRDLYSINPNEFSDGPPTTTTKPPTTTNSPPATTKHTDAPPATTKHTDAPPATTKHTDAPPATTKHTDAPPATTKHTDAPPATTKHTDAPLVY